MKRHSKLAIYCRLVFLLSLSFCSNKNEKEAILDKNSEQEVPSKELTTSSGEELSIISKDTIDTIQFLTEEDFISKITDISNPKGFQYKGDLPCIVDFYADWCRPCHALTPILEEVAKKYRGQIIVYKLNVDKAVRTSRAFAIQSIPTLIFFKPNSMPAKIVGAPEQTELEKAINELLLEN